VCAVKVCSIPTGAVTSLRCSLFGPTSAIKVVLSRTSTSAVIRMGMVVMCCCGACAKANLTVVHVLNANRRPRAWLDHGRPPCERPLGSLLPTSMQMVHDSFAKRKHVRRGTCPRSALVAIALAVTSFVAQPAWAQAQANPQPQTSGSATPPPAPRPTISVPVIPAAPVRPVVPTLPPAGKTPAVVTAPPPLAKPFPLEVDLPRNQAARMDLAGYKGGVFLRDSTDAIRFQVRGRLHLDFHSFFDAGKDELDAESGSVFLSPSLSVRRARIEVAADLWRRWFALFGLDFGSQPVANLSGARESGPFQTPTPSAKVANAYIDYTFLRQLHVMLGQHQAPFSLENRTDNTRTTWLERNMPIRSFVVPNGKEIGAVLWGDINDVQTVSYEFGVFLGDGTIPRQVDG